MFLLLQKKEICVHPCDIRRNRYLVFVFHPLSWRPWHIAPRILGFSEVLPAFLCANEGTPEQSLNGGWLPGEPTMSLETGTFSPTGWLPGRRKGQEVESVTESEWFDQSCLYNTASVKTQKDRVQRASKLVNMWRFGWVASSGENLEASSPFPVPCSVHQFYLAVLALYPLTTNW